MPHLGVADRVKETTTTTGTGTIDLAGAVEGYQTFVAGIGNGHETYYSISNRDADEWEVGYGTITDAATDTLSRSVVISSSNGGSLVNFSAGTKDVICTLPADRSFVIDDEANVSVTANVTATAFDGSGAALTSLNASNLASGTLPDARFPATIPASSGANLTNLNASNVSSGTLDNARLSAIPNSALENSAITINGTSTDLGGSINVGDITGVTAGTGISGGGTTGDVSVALDLNELTTSTSDADGDFFAVVDSVGNQKKLTKANINLSGFNNDLPGDIEGVTAGNGLTGGGTTGTVTLNVGAGTGIDVSADAVAVDVSDFMTNGANNRVVTATGTDAMNAETNLVFDGNNLGVGTASPSQTLEVSGSGARIYLTAANEDISMDASGNGQIAIDGNGYQGAIALDADAMNIYTNSLSRDLVLGVNETEILRAKPAGVDVDGTLTATTFSGSGASLTSIPNGALDNSSITINGSGVSLGGSINVGDITGVTAGSGLTGGGTTGAVTLNVGAGNLIDVTADAIDVDLSELTTSTSDTDGDFFVVVDSANAQKKLTKGNINISGFNNDAGYTTNVGDITGVTAGTNLTGGGTSGTVTLNMATGGIGAGTYGSTANATKIDTITVDAYGRVTAVATGATGDIEGVTAGSGLTGGGTSGTPTLNVGAGTGIDVAADTVSVDVSDFMTNGSNNRVLTATGTDAMNAEANMTFDGSTLDVSGTILTDKAYIALATLTDGATINWDMADESVAKVTLAGNRTMAAPTNGSTGQFASITVIQDGTGSRTLTWNAVYEFKDDTAPTLTTTGGKGDLFVFQYNGSKWLEVGRNLNLTQS